MGNWGDEMVQLAKVPTAKLDNPILTSKTQMVEGEKQFLKVVF